MGLTSEIEKFLLDMLDLVDTGHIEIGRNELADRFQCAPSQINYVLTTRFTPYQGYYVESRRGGRGYIKIVKLDMTEDELVHEILSNTISDELTFDKVRHITDSLVKEKVLTEKEGLLIKHSVDDNALKDIDMSSRNFIRSSIFKNILLALVRE
ncbi:MAG: CtsR family transcriptional regulator [Tissierellia bacterium]|nr:CtsR family transcriptional regulator [Tissierellia bacterium]